jgi:hypothetical protein
MTITIKAQLLAIVVVASALAHAAHAQSTDASRDWTQEKCARYGRAWTEALDRYGRDGLSRDFLDRHTAFVTGGCTAKADVCPRSDKELALANILTIRAMNAYTASSFLPFACAPK